MKKTSLRNGVIGGVALLAAYIGIITFVSGWEFTERQFAGSWYFVLSLSVGFGVQVGLYTALRNAVRARAASKGIVMVSGTTSTVAMVSCCAHYLANIVPIIGVAGALAVIGQYQRELFWFGLAMNAVGIAYLIRKIIQVNVRE